MFNKKQKGGNPMYKNPGLIKEDEFVYALNNKKYGSLSENLQFMLKKIFDQINDEEIIHCELVPDFQKPDFKISVNGISKTVSLKSGHTTVIHEEYFKTFIPFLLEAGMSQESVDFLLYFCYADGTKDGTGIDQYDFNMLKVKYALDIKRFNKEVMNNKDLIKKVVYRCMFKGSKEQNIEADYIYFGSVKYGFLCSKKQIFRHLERRDWAYMDNPHIGPLQLRPHYRGHNLGDYKEKRRHQMDVWWANLAPDLEYISERYDG